ncbi:hypothetical protein BCD72_000663 [Clostridium butyricum]|nr:hypothetical protein [Clostridium butyricum]MBA8972007.1 hypothetical protein [Clostridium butyricum]NOW36128.1 hypothetical protein [Clostridium butyricum]GEQ18354.1 hypothetical protein CBU01nite_29900 [Clostridium butyricum]
MSKGKNRKKYKNIKIYDFRILIIIINIKVNLVGKIRIIYKIRILKKEW